MSNQGEVTQLLAVGAEPPAPASQSTIAGNPMFGGGTPLGGAPAGLEPPSQIVMHDVHLVSKKPQTSKLATGVATALIVVAAIIGYVYLETGAFPDVLSMIGLDNSGDEMAMPVAPKKKPAQPETVAEPVPPAAQSPSTSQKPGSERVWDLVENEIGGDLAEPAANLSVDQEAIFREKLAHEFPYQRYLGVLELSALRARGSEDMLREALESPKFWTRMRALIGLADMGEEITGEDVSLALGQSHSELRARFFKRFEKSPCSPGCFYVARAALPHLDSLGRSQVVRVIAREESPVRDLYLVAASYDASDLVKAAAAEWLDKNHVEAGTYEHVKRLLGSNNAN